MDVFKRHMIMEYWSHPDSRYWSNWIRYSTKETSIWDTSNCFTIQDEGSRWFRYYFSRVFS